MSWFGKVETEGGFVAGQWNAGRKTTEVGNTAAGDNDPRSEITDGGAVAAGIRFALRGASFCEKSA